MEDADVFETNFPRRFVKTVLNRDEVSRYADIELVSSGGCVFSVHLPVLSACSPLLTAVFEDLQTDAPVSVHLPTISKSVARMVVAVMYTGECYGAASDCDKVRRLLTFLGLGSGRFAIDIVDTHAVTLEPHPSTYKVLGDGEPPSPLLPASVENRCPTTIDECSDLKSVRLQALGGVTSPVLFGAGSFTNSNSNVIENPVTTQRSVSSLRNKTLYSCDVIAKGKRCYRRIFEGVKSAGILLNNTENILAYVDGRKHLPSPKSEPPELTEDRHVDDEFKLNRTSYSNRHLTAEKSKRKRLRCSLRCCGRTFRFRKTFSAHMRKHMTNDDAHLERNRTRSLSQQGKSHTRIQHGKTRSRLKQPFKCEHCQKPFSSELLLARHLRNHTTEKPVLNNNNRPAMKRYICEVSKCGKQFNYRLNFLRHTSVKHTSELNDNVTNFPCGECPKVFDKKRHLHEHVRLVHSATKGHTCYVCGLTFSSTRELCNHRRTHADVEKPHKCPICRKSFARKDYMITYHFRTHSGIWSHICDICGQRFRDQGHLNMHRKSFHSGARVKRFSCDQCAKTFYANYQLKSHVFNVHTRIKAHKCSLCAYAAVRKDNLRIHVEKMHTPKPLVGFVT